MAEGVNRPPAWVPVFLQPGPGSPVEGRCSGREVATWALPKQSCGDLRTDGAGLALVLNRGSLVPVQAANVPSGPNEGPVAPVKGASSMSNTQCHADVAKHDTTSAAAMIAGAKTIDAEASSTAEKDARPEGRRVLTSPRCDMSRDRRQKTETTVVRSRETHPLHITPPDIDKRKKERNRKAQRDFRERQKKKISLLEAKVTSLQADVDILQIKSAKLRRENEFIQSLMYRLDHVVYVYSAKH